MSRSGQLTVERLSEFLSFSGRNRHAPSLAPQSAQRIPRGVSPPSPRNHLNPEGFQRRLKFPVRGRGDNPDPAIHKLPCHAGSDTARTENQDAAGDVLPINHQIL